MFHLAALVPNFENNPSAEKMISVNVTGTYHLLDSLRKSHPQARVMVAGSSAMYGGSANRPKPVTEDAAVQPESLYGTAKAAQDMVAYQFFAQHGLFTVRGRTFNQVGPGEGIDRVCGLMAKQVASIESGAQEPFLRIRTLTPRRDFTDVRDVVEGYWSALEHGEPGGTYNICSGRSESVRRIVEVLLNYSRVNGIEVEETGPAPGPQDLLDQIGCARRLESISGWRPTISFEQSLRDLLNDWRTRIAAESGQVESRVPQI